MIHIPRDRSDAADAEAVDEAEDDELEDLPGRLRGDALAGAPEEVAWPILLRAHLDALPEAPRRRRGAVRALAPRVRRRLGRGRC